MNEANTMADILGETIDERHERLGHTAPRVTPADLEANIARTEIVMFRTAGGQILRWAVLTTRCGFAVTGDPSASVSPENDDSALGEHYAIANARRALWPLMGYALRERLHNERQAGEAHVRMERQATVQHGNTVAGFIGWLSADIPELHSVEVPRLAASYDRFLEQIERQRAGTPTSPPPVLDSDDAELERATAEGMPEPRVAEVAPPPFAGFPPGHPGNPL